MQTTLIIGREDLLSDSREKPFGEIQGGDLPWNYEQTVAEVIWFEDGGKRIRIKDRENALDGVVIDSSTNVQALATLPAGAGIATVVEVRVTKKRRRNSGLVGVAQPRLVRLWLACDRRNHLSVVMLAAG